ncbi:hypothetical protein KUF71_004283 [Frankliniella fusca]|uniref:YqaJ viral recombinase domain-containing protein n=1 Tax=Frankliniella fusca TaxID=407009 RepID=A0AAE1GWU4_9NEOP|nr:hypothetical protein KUF71_004283 [Frankliniella fusca]
MYDRSLKGTPLLILTSIMKTVTCTSRPCEWNRGSLQRNPGNIRDKLYPAYKIDVKRRQHFDPRPTSHRTKEATQQDINNFMSALSKNPEKTRWQYHLELKYTDYDLDCKGKKRLAMLCRKFLKNLPEVIVTENAPTTEDGLIAYTYNSLPEDTVYEIPGTRTQGGSMNWGGRRSVLVTASVAYRAFHLTDRGLSGFLQSHLWSIDQAITPAMAYGTKHEPIARDAYMKWRHENRDVIDGELGLHVNSSYPGLGCSPDGIVYSPSMPPGLLEIKCLSAQKDKASRVPTAFK